MKKKIFWIIYSIVLINIGILYGYHNSSLINIFLFPFSFVGNGIRYFLMKDSLSLIIGIILFIFLSAVPILYLLFRYKKRKVLSWEIILLSLLAFLNSFTIYLFINPEANDKIANFYFNSLFNTRQFVFASIYYSLFFLYCGLRVMYYKETTATNIITKILLYGLTVIITSKMIVNSIRSIMISINFLDIEIAEVIEIVLKYIFQSIFNVSAIYILIRLQRNFIRLNDGNIIDNSISEVKRINKFATTFFAVAIFITISFIIIQVLFDQNPFRLFSLPIIELSIFFITWVISRYSIKNNNAKQME